MKRDKWSKTLACIGLVAAVIAGGAIAAGSQGSQSNPLVTLDYLNGVAVPEIMEQVDKLVKERFDKLKKEQKTESLTFQTVELKEGETLTPEAGSQFLLRSGTLASTDALVDLTTGETWTNDGTLAENHLYIATGDKQTVTAGADAILLFQGGYTVK